MTGIDLIPADYRDMLRVRRWFKLSIISVAVIVMVTVLTKGALAYLIEAQNDAIGHLQQSKTSVVNNEKILDSLTRQKSSIEYKLDILNSLQHGPATNKLFTAIDKAMSKDIWFQEMSYLNKPETDKVKGETVNTGYFIVVPQGSESTRDAKNPGKQNKLLTKVEIKGQARDHSVLASFVNRLNAQPVFSTVKIVNTQLRRYTKTEVVDFTLAASTQPLPESSP